MKSPEKRGKKLVYISEGILDKVAEISKKKGASITKYIEDLLEQAVRIDRLGFRSEELADLLEVIHVLRVLGANFVPLDVANSSIESEPGPGLGEKWYESGRLYGRYMRERFKHPIGVLGLMLRVMRWDLNEVDAIQDGSFVTVRCVSTSLTVPVAISLSKFIEGAMHGIGYRTDKIETMKGIVIGTFRME
ncbi:MAG: hypothetical protein ABC505_03215 [Candidatus Methanosuratincola petrocarbonis]|nr:hypothetical protein [Candidatus Methanosuratincola sp.]